MSDDRTDHERQRDRALTAALRAAQWELGTIVDALPAGRVTAEGWRDLLMALEYLTDLVRMRSGDTNGPAIERPSTTD